MADGSVSGHRDGRNNSGSLAVRALPFPAFLLTVSFLFDARAPPDILKGFCAHRASWSRPRWTLPDSACRYFIREPRVPSRCQPRGRRRLDECMIVSLALEAWSCIMMWAKAREEVRDASVLLLKFCCMLQGREARPRSGRPDGDVLTAGYYHVRVS